MTTNELSFQDVEKLVHSLAHRYHTYCGGDLEELQGEALLAYAQAYRSYDASRGAFTTWVHHSVWNALRDNGRRISKHKMRQTRVSQLDNEVELEQAPARRYFDWVELGKELSLGAHLVLSLVFDPPKDLKLALFHRSPDNSSAIQDAVTAFLLDIGWSGRKVLDTWEEIGEAIA